MAAIRLATSMEAGTGRDSIKSLSLAAEQHPPHGEHRKQQPAKQGNQSHEHQHQALHAHGGKHIH